MTQASFIAQAQPYANQVQQETGISADLLVAQWAKESAYGTSQAATQNNNYGGIKQGNAPNTGPSPDSVYAGFSSFGSFAQADATYYETKRYDTLRADAKAGASIAQQAQDIQNAGYANPGTGYAASIDGMVNNFYGAGTSQESSNVAVPNLSVKIISPGQAIGSSAANALDGGTTPLLTPTGTAQEYTPPVNKGAPTAIIDTSAVSGPWGIVPIGEIQAFGVGAGIVILGIIILALGIYFSVKGGGATKLQMEKPE